MHKEETTIYVNLLNEKEGVIPVKAFSLGEDKYQILMYVHYNFFGENPWEFEPGSIVRCEHDKQERLVAVEKVGVIESTEIYLRLLEEATETARPVRAFHLGENKYQILIYGDYIPEEDEVWEFTPGSIVRCENVKWSRNGETIFLAVEKVG